MVNNQAIQLSVTYSNDVTPLVIGTGSIDEVNNGAHVAATQTNSGSISTVNNGQVVAAAINCQHHG